MDELAVALKLDPLELRLRCYSDRDQNTNRPYSSKSLRACYHQGAESVRLGQAQSGAALDARRQRARRLGHGNRHLGSAADADRACASCSPPMAMRRVSCATSDIGTGTYTIMAQVAADMLGLPMENITIKLGDSTLPQIPRRRRIVDCGLDIERDRDDSRCDPRGIVASDQDRCRIRRLPTPDPIRSRSRTESS